MQKDGLMTTAEFAKLCHVEKRTLFFYDEIGLLKPERVLENRYRLYGMNQYRKMDMLKALQSTGMSLEEIKTLMNSTDRKETLHAYRTQTQQLKEKIAAMQDTLSYLEEVTTLMEAWNAYGEHVLFQRKDKGSWLHTIPITQSGTPLQVDYLTCGYELGVISNDVEHIQPDYLFRKVKKNAGNTRMEAGLYAVMFQRTQNNRIGTSAQHFTDAIKASGLQYKPPVYISQVWQDWTLQTKETVLCFEIQLL